MKNLTLILALIFSHYAFAQKAKMLVVGPKTETQRAIKEFDVEYAEPQLQILPEKIKRDAFLKNINQSKKWDEIRKDIFYMQLLSRSISELKAKFPEFSEIELKSLKEKRKLDQ